MPETAVTTNVQVTPQVTLQSNDEAGAKYIAAALIKSSQIQAAGTESLAVALARKNPAPGEAGGSPAKPKTTTNPANLALWGLIAWALLKG